jgi:hypothetical protein
MSNAVPTTQPPAEAKAIVESDNDNSKRVGDDGDDGDDDGGGDGSGDSDDGDDGDDSGGDDGDDSGGDDAAAV